MGGVGSGLISPPVTERAVILRFIGEIYMDTVLVRLVLCFCLKIAAIEPITAFQPACSEFLHVSDPT